MQKPTKKHLEHLHATGQEMSLHGGFVAGDLLRAAVYGANDGIVTTFAVVAGVAGAQLSADVILILGIANMIADGLSMGIGDYLGSVSEEKFKQRQLSMEAWEYKKIPEIEQEEIFQMYREKGYSADDAKKLVEIHAKNPDHMVELGFQSEMGAVPERAEHLWRTGVATFAAFVVAGALPLLPYMVAAVGVPVAARMQFPISIGMTLAALFLVGSLRTRLTGGSWWKNGLEILGVGSIAAVAAYVLGVLVERFIV
ncbi:VIT1/CCC1 transporter family protein [Candidatus Woesebacteria bacterium]|nr:VIT1/CCC1 transporter family protein [Candidatus Woesebacteria bacterium]MCD8527275.1 VIT1/CCC1 transporter family protein [Candidatus Woesebacteria bacterium]MCD8546641.1 VIT1/CCC1 transporter family protein [Candidatus Woesebacteria bacterium]